MLNLMRKHAGSWIIKVLLGLVVIAFIPFGYGLYQDQRKEKVATVNGKPISYEEYQRVLSNLRNQTRQRFGGSLTDEMLKILQLEKKALDQIIDHRILLSEAENLGFKVSDQELVESIRKMEAFHLSGRFNENRYKGILRRLRTTTDDFEKQQKELILVEKLKSFILGNIKISNLEMLEWYKWNGSTVNMDFVFFDPKKYKDIKPTKDEIQAFFNETKNDYKTDVKLKTRYIYFDPKDYRKKVEVTDEEVKIYYESNPEEFHTPKTVEARHILFKVNQNSSNEENEKARNKALKVLDMAKSGNDFSELAKKYSEGPTKDRGGYLGEFRKETMVKAFADKAFSMNAGEISDLVKTRFGWHIIKVEKVNEESKTSFEKAEKQIRNKLIDEKANADAYDDAQVVYDASFEGDDLIRTAKDKNLVVNTTDFFTRQSPINGIRNSAKFAETAFELEISEISGVQDFGSGLYILQVIDKIPEKIPDLEDVEDKVVTDLIIKKQEERASQDAEKLLSAMKSGGILSEESSKFGLKSETTGFFKRNGSIPKIGYEREISTAVFKLTKDKKLTDSAIKGKKGYYVFQFRERKVPPTEGFKNEEESIKKRLMQQKKNEIFESWLARLKSKNEIIMENAFLE